MPTIFEQADRGKTGPVYSWIVAKPSFNTPKGREVVTSTAMEEMGWRMVKSAAMHRKSAFVTNDPTAVVRLLHAAPWMHAPISNGTHAVCGASMYEFDFTKEN